MNPRDLQKAMKRFGIRVEELNAVRISVELDDGSKLVVEEPQVMVMRAKGQPPMLYVVGDLKRVEEEKEEGAVEISDEDIDLVVEQTGASREEARRVLEEVGGDIAEAILRLQQRG